MMRCVIVDDEPLARKGIQLLIEQMPGLEIAGQFSNVIDADAFLKHNPVDILFLDIQMPKVNGMDFIKSSKHSVHVIITTAYPQFAVDAFELEVTDYLVKPIRFERFYKAISRVNPDKKDTGRQVMQEDDYIFIRSERKYIRSNFSEIDYIEGLKDYVIIHCGSEKHIVASNLKTIHASLPQQLFIRINKSFIVNTSKIKTIDHEWVVIDTKKIPIGLNFKKNVLDFLSQKKVIKR